MIVCPRCGNENLEGSKFCSNCGTALIATDPAAPREERVADVTVPPTPEPTAAAAGGAAAAMPPSIPEPRTWSPRPPSNPNDPSALPASAPEWRMSDAGPLPEPRRRRRWLWIVLGVLGACLLVCVGLTIWGNTESGTRVLNDLATSLAEAATPEAEGAGTPGAGE